MATCFSTTVPFQSYVEIKNYSEPHCPVADFLSVKLVNVIINLLTFCERPESPLDFISITLATPYNITRRDAASSNGKYMYTKI